MRQAIGEAILEVFDEEKDQKLNFNTSRRCATG